MIRALEPDDCGDVLAIVNENWRRVYSGYVDPALLSKEGCMRRNGELVRDFVSKRTSEYVWEENDKILGMISFGKTGEKDCPEAFEVWRLYVARDEQNRGIGGGLLDFAEKQARIGEYSEIVIWAFKRNVNAVAFYQNRGYRADREELLGAPYNAEAVRLKKLL